jgi:hypothetical protein
LFPFVKFDRNFRLQTQGGKSDEKVSRGKEKMTACSEAAFSQIFEDFVTKGCSRFRRCSSDKAVCFCRRLSS